MDRNVNVMSGAICVGKSRLVKELLKLPEFRDAATVTLDQVGIRHWGRRIMTKTEKVYRNELARNEVKEQLIVNWAEHVLVDMPMLTRANHQKPFVEMIGDAERYLRLIDPERDALEGKKITTNRPFVYLNVVLLYCDFETVKRRITVRGLEAEKSDSPAVSMEAVLDVAVQFELPKDYVPLPIDTSDESESAEELRMREIRGFLLERKFPTSSVFRERMAQARACRDELKEEARRRGMMSGAAFIRSDYTSRR